MVSGGSTVEESFDLSQCTLGNWRWVISSDVHNFSQYKCVPRGNRRSFTSSTWKEEMLISHFYEQTIEKYFLMFI